MDFECKSKQSKSKWKNFKGGPSDVQDTLYIVYIKYDSKDPALNRKIDAASRS